MLLECNWGENLSYVFCKLISSGIIIVHGKLKCMYQKLNNHI